MKTPQNPSSFAPPSLVRDLDDQALRSRHALLDHHRADAFSRWLDEQLEELEWRFRGLATPQSLRSGLRRSTH